MKGAELCLEIIWSFLIHCMGSLQNTWTFLCEVSSLSLAFSLRSPLGLFFAYRAKGALQGIRRGVDLNSSGITPHNEREKEHGFQNIC